MMSSISLWFNPVYRILVKMFKTQVYKPVFSRFFKLKRPRSFFGPLLISTLLVLQVSSPLVFAQLSNSIREDTGNAIANLCDGKTGDELKTCEQQKKELESGGFKTDCKDASLNSSNCGIIKYLLLFINGLSAIVGIVIVIMIIVGGIQYSMAGNNPQGTEAAKKRIASAVVALLLYIFTFAFLQWIVPGGIF